MCLNYPLEIYKKNHILIIFWGHFWAPIVNDPYHFGCGSKTAYLHSQKKGGGL